MQVMTSQSTRGLRKGVSTRARRLCTLCAAAVLAAALPTFFADGVLHGTPVMNGSARGTALVMSLVAFPVLVVGLMAWSKGSCRGQAVVIGALGYTTYNAMLFVFATPFNELFLLYVALLALSFWSLVSALLEPLPGLHPDAALPTRAVAAFIFTVVGLNAAAWLMAVIPRLGQHPPSFLRGTGLTTNPIYVQDLAIWLPALAIIALLLWQRRAAGVFLAGAGLVFWQLEAVGVAVDQWFGHQAAPPSDVATLGGAAIFVVLAGVTALPLAVWLRRVRFDTDGLDSSKRLRMPPTAQRPQRSTRSQGQSVASQPATASASGTSRSALSARTHDCTATSKASEDDG